MSEDQLCEFYESGRWRRRAIRYGWLPILWATLAALFYATRWRPDAKAVQTEIDANEVAELRLPPPPPKLYVARWGLEPTGGWSILREGQIDCRGQWGKWSHPIPAWYFNFDIGAYACRTCYCRRVCNYPPPDSVMWMEEDCRFVDCNNLTSYSPHRDGIGLIVYDMQCAACPNRDDRSCGGLIER